ncbi:MAG: hypothetical protein ACTSPB_06430 [Candidatus Thorarchaeota archaeon]
MDKKYERTYIEYLLNEYGEPVPVPDGDFEPYCAGVWLAGGKRIYVGNYSNVKSGSIVIGRPNEVIEGNYTLILKVPSFHGKGSMSTFHYTQRQLKSRFVGATEVWIEWHVGMISAKGFPLRSEMKQIQRFKALRPEVKFRLFMLVPDDYLLRKTEDRWKLKAMIEDETQRVKLFKAFRVELRKLKIIEEEN